MHQPQLPWSAAETDLAVAVWRADFDVADLGAANPDFAVAFVGEPEHVDRTGERRFYLGLEGLSVEIVGQFEGELAGGLGDADAYVHVGPFEEGRAHRRECSTQMELSTVPDCGLIRGNHVIDAIDTTGDDHPVPRRSVVIVAFDGMQPLDAVGPHEVFAGATAVLASKNRKAAGYDLALVSQRGATDHDRERAAASSPSPLPAARTRIDTLLIPGGDGAKTARHSDELVGWIREAARSCRRLGTVCTGAFIAAEAGLLDGRTVTTHWASARQLADEYPLLDVDPDPIYRRDGSVWTSAGVTAGIDLVAGHGRGRLRQ